MALGTPAQIRAAQAHYDNMSEPDEQAREEGEGDCPECAGTGEIVVNACDGCSSRRRGGCDDCPVGGVEHHECKRCDGTGFDAICQECGVRFRLDALVNDQCPECRKALRADVVALDHEAGEVTA